MNDSLSMSIAQHNQRTLGDSIIDELESYNLERLIMSSVMMVVYGPFCMTIFIKFKMYLDVQSISIMLLYLSTIIISFAYSIYQIFTPNEPNPLPVHITTLTAEFTVLAVFYQIIYELRLVQLKLEC